MAAAVAFTSLVLVDVKLELFVEFRPDEWSAFADDEDEEEEEEADELREYGLWRCDKELDVFVGKWKLDEDDDDGEWW